MLPSVNASMYFYAEEDKTLPSKSLDIEENDGFSGKHQKNVDGAEIMTADREQQMNSEMSGKGAMTTHHADSPQFSCSRAFSVLWTHFTMSYSNEAVVVWSIWWALAMAGFLQVNKSPDLSHTSMHIMVRIGRHFDCDWSSLHRIFKQLANRRRYFLKSRQSFSSWTHIHL